jgi:hypothetical protein
MCVARRRLRSAALALAAIGCITFLVGDLAGKHPVRAGGVAIVGVALLMAVAGQSLWRAGAVSDQLRAAEGARSGGRDSAGAVASLSDHGLVIISPDHPELYARVLRAFGSSRRTRVIYDRRLSQRRRGGAAPPAERRQGERRTRATVDAEITAFGSAIVRLD